MYIDQNSHLKLEGRAKVVLNDNKAYLGGGIYMKSSFFIANGNSSFIFINNTALRDGGAIYSRDPLHLNSWNILMLVGQFICIMQQSDIYAIL